MRLTSRESVADTAWSRRNLRFRLALFFSRLWLFMAWRRMTLPAPVTLKRFDAAFFVFCLGTLCSSQLADVLVRGEHHDHVASVEERRRLDLPEVLDVLGEAHEQVAPALRMRRLAAAEHDRHLHLGPLAEEAHDVSLLRLVILGRDLRAQLDLLDVNLRLVLPRRLGLLLLLVPVLAVVHHLAYRRIGARRDLDQVEILAVGVLERLVRSLDPDLRAVGVDEANLGASDPLVDPD